MGIYVFAPAGAKKMQSNVIEKCVEYIGSNQVGIGSNIAKGRRYLKRQLGCRCSTRAVKRTISKKTRIINNPEYETFGIDVYYYHKNLCSEIVEKIIEYMEENANDKVKMDIFGCLPSGDRYLDLTYEYRLSQLGWIQNENYQNQGEGAKKIKEDFYILRENLSRNI